MSSKKTSANKSKIIVFSLLFSPIVLLAFVIYFFSGLFMPPFNSYANTVFAPGFTWEEFNQIKIGDSQEKTLSRLGPPLRIRKVSGSSELECWQYSQGNKIPFINFDEYIVEICIDTSHKVVGTHIFR